ncbi:hypothetical protein GDO86_018642 [Hymenochirus boettgeri]|uniref:Nicotinamide N-methyltransferase n=1 Tax=Hymenochirus boettgeri TaxID=247094 RepID=A0A8T2IBR6_9PIPI|nr:hypothetical protein GDO86_018642 [Hymenochirus boettgeri]
MASTQHKHYHDEEFDTCCNYETYIGSNKVFNENFVEDIMKNVYKILTSGSVKGDTILDISVGLLRFPLFVVADYFKTIIMIDSSNSSIEEMQKWIKREPGSVDKSHMAAFACALKGKSTGWKEQEEKLRIAIKQIVKWDISQENPLGSVTLPQADCLISVMYLDGVCKDHEMYLKTLRHFSSLLKTGGHLILISCINNSYYTVGQHRFSALKYDEKFARKSLKDSGFDVKSFDKIERKFDSPMSDYEYMGCFLSCKEREI